MRSVKDPPKTLNLPKRRSAVIGRFIRSLPVIRQKYGVKRIGVFGSFARGDQTRKSDIDILVEFAPGQATLQNFIGLADFLEELSKRKVDLLTVEGINRYIRPRIEEEVIWLEG
jgi:predicted nucleotidyltransferase